VPIVLKFGSLKLLEPSGPVQGLFTNAYVKLRKEFDTAVYITLFYVMSEYEPSLLVVGKGLGY